jgi:hypothetical protein
VDWWNITDKVLTEKKKGRLSGRMIESFSAKSRQYSRLIM